MWESRQQSSFYYFPPMNTAFITLALPVPSTIVELHATIETALKHHGEPLRWAITRIENETAHIEAIVTTA
jgi:hypothetical protein